MIKKLVYLFWLSRNEVQVKKKFIINLHLICSSPILWCKFLKNWIKEIFIFAEKFPDISALKFENNIELFFSLTKLLTWYIWLSKTDPSHPALLNYWHKSFGNWLPISLEKWYWQNMDRDRLTNCQFWMICGYFSSNLNLPVHKHIYSCILTKIL